MTQNRQEIIEEAMLQEMADLGIDDTLENRLAFLTGLRDGWTEDPTTSLEKTFYLISIGMMITSLKIKLAFTP